MIVSRKQTIARVSHLSGFTLIEVLIATAMFAVVLVALNTVFYGALRLTTRSTQSADTLLSRHDALRTLREDLRNMAPPGGTLGGELLVHQSAKGPSASPQIEFQTTTGIVGPEMPWIDIQRVAYYLRPPLWFTNSLGFELVRSTTRNLLPSLEDAPVEEPLLPDVEAIEFAFHDGQTWLDSWNPTQRETPLKAIKVRIHLAAERTELQPVTALELVVPILVESNTNVVPGSSGISTPSDSPSGGPQSGNNNNNNGPRSNNNAPGGTQSSQGAPQVGGPR